MHAKERVIGLILRDELGLIVRLAVGVDTDRFGTFSREVARQGSQLNAARAKNCSRVRILSVGTCGAGKRRQFRTVSRYTVLADRREIVLMVDRQSGFELIGRDIALETSFLHLITRDVDQDIDCAQIGKFPEQGILVMGINGQLPTPDILLAKDIKLL
jgi:hypothetical protein